MSTPKSTPSNNNSSNNLNPDLIRDFFAHQKQQFQIESKQLELREKEIDNAARYSERALELQAEILKQKPSHDKSKLITLTVCVSAFVLIFLTFIGYCIFIGKESFVLDFLKIAGYFVTTIMGYYFGKKSNNAVKKTDEEIQEY